VTSSSPPDPSADTRPDPRPDTRPDARPAAPRDPRPAARGRDANRALAARLVLGAFVIVAVFFAFQRDHFVDVWKPLTLYCALGVPAFIALKRMRDKQAAQR
jgi:hypothetical protein